jgi:glucose-1-phosphate thymidylyltransferase
MKIIIPMAGKGSRLRPHTLTVPKPLIPIAGKPIVQRLVEDLAESYGKPVTEVAFICGEFGSEVEADLKEIAEGIGAKGTIYYQDEPLGIAHALLCAKNSLEGPVMVAFADTLFKADFTFDADKDGIIWVHRVPDPSAFGVVQLNQEGFIIDFVEKPKHFVSDMAIVGIYYFRDGENFRNELQYLIDNDIKERGEYQMTSALENMKNNGKKFFTGQVEEWLDCGNKDAVVFSNRRILEIKKDQAMVHPSLVLDNSILIPPCYIGEGVTIQNSIVGPHVSIGKNSTVEHSVISDSLIQESSFVKNANFSNSMIGNAVEYLGKTSEISIGDYSKYML